MKKTMIAIMAVALVLTMLCGQALATTGDLTIKEAKAYSDAAMTDYLGTIPAYTALLVRSYDSYADVRYNGRTVYISADTLLRKDAPTKYVATLSKGTTVIVYQRKGQWAYIKTLRGTSGYVKLSSIQRA